MFDWLFKFLGSMLSFFNSITGSYALALLLWALVFKIVFLPFSIKQQKNQIAMAKLTPKIELIRAKYRGRTDQKTMQKQQQEIMELQQKEGYNPLSGCLPLLIQLPLIILLYNVIQSPISYMGNVTPEFENQQAVIAEDERKDLDDVILDVYNFIGESNFEATEKVPEFKPAESLPKNSEITLINSINKYIGETENGKAVIEEIGLDVDSIPKFTVFGVNLADQPSFKNFSILVLIPFLAAAASWFSMWLTKRLNKTGIQSETDKQTQASMKMMDIMMPLMTLFFAFNFSGMLGLYWVYQSLLGIGQSVILAKVMPLPKFTEEDIKNLNKQKKEAEKAQREALKAQPKHKSLHYIDEDDYDELPEVKKTPEEEKTDLNKGDMPQIKD